MSMGTIRIGEQDISLQVLLTMCDLLATYKERRCNDRQHRFVHFNNQKQGHGDVHDVYKSQAVWALVTGVLSGAFSFGGALSTSLGPMAIAGFSNVDINALTDQQKNIAETINKMLSAASGATDTTGRVVSTCKEGERYPKQTGVDVHRMNYDDFTRQMEEALQSGQSLENFLEKWIQTQQEIARQSSRLAGG